MSGILRIKVVSGYVMEVLGLTVGAQSHLLAARVLNFPVDKVLAAARALKEIDRGGIQNVKVSKMCLDEADGFVYILFNVDDIALRYRGWKVVLGDASVGFKAVESIVCRTGSFRQFFNMEVRLHVIPASTSVAPDAAVPFHIENEVISAYVFEALDLDFGQQCELVAAKGLTCQNMVKYVARSLKQQSCGPPMLSTLKLVYDWSNATVYIRGDLLKSLAKWCPFIGF